MMSSAWGDSPGNAGTLTVPSLPASVSAIRRFALAACAPSAPSDVCDAVELLVSEVATNALVHGCGDVRVRVQAGPSVVRVEVTDDSPRPPLRREAGTDGEGGRGMALVDALACGWGTVASPPGKMVWFEVDSLAAQAGLPSAELPPYGTATDRRPDATS